MVTPANLTAIKVFSLPFIAEAIYIGYQALRKISPKVLETTEIVVEENMLTEKLLGDESSVQRKTILIHKSPLGRAEQ